jgi:hypothetical protein
MAGIENPEQVLRDLVEQNRVVTQQYQDLAARFERAGETINQLQAELQQQRAAGVPVGRPPAAHGLDTRNLGKPDVFSGETSKWRDWSIVLRSYISAADHNATALLAHAETSREPVRNLALDAASSAISSQLYYVLVMTCRGPALDRVVNSGPGEGLEAWRQLTLANDPRTGTRHAGMLLELLSFSFEGDILARLEAFERDLAKYEQSTGERMPAGIKIGTVVRQSPEGALRQHLIMNMDRFQTWESFKHEIQNVKRAQAAAQSGPSPMNLDTLENATPESLTGLANQILSLAKGKGKGKGKNKGKGKSNQSASPCPICNKPGHTKSECWYQTAGKGQPQQSAKGKSKGKGKTKGGRGNDTRQCWHCNQTGHISSQCPQRRNIHEVAADPHAGTHDQYYHGQWQYPAPPQQGHYAANPQGHYPNAGNPLHAVTPHAATPHAVTPHAATPHAATPQATNGNSYQNTNPAQAMYITTLEREMRIDGVAAGAGTIPNTASRPYGGPHPTTVSFGIDSGAAASVIPPTMCFDYPLHRDDRYGERYRSASGHTVIDQGRRDVYVAMQGATKMLRMRVLDTTKPLISVYDLCKTGHRVVFEIDEQGNDLSHAVRTREPYHTYKFTRRNNVWDLDVSPIPHSAMDNYFESEGESVQRYLCPFPGQARP